MNYNLTEKDYETRDAIINYIEKFGYPPSIRDLCDILGLSSTSSVHSRLKKLKEEGIIETDAAMTSRAIRVIGYKFVKE